MFSHHSFLILGADSPADILSLLKGGLEVSDFSFSFQQGVDDRGKVTTRVYAGTISLTLSQLPNQTITEWSLNSRKKLSGMVVMLNDENIPIEKIIFENGVCTYLDISYTQTGKSYISTKIMIEAETLIVGNGINYDSEWSE